MKKLMLRGCSENIVALPVHDAVAFPESRAAQMVAMFESVRQQEIEILYR